MKLRQLFVIVFITLLVYACAQRGRPDGGPVDEEPPIILTERPPNYSNLFEADELQINFDEFIKLNKNPQFII